MRRKEKEITDKKRINSILQDAMVCRLGLSVHDQPYVVPLSFVYEGDHLFIHSSPEGKKIDMLRYNATVCFEVESGVSLKESGNICSTGMKYDSIIGYGNSLFIEDIDEKKRVLKLIAHKYTGTNAADIPDDAVAKTLIIRIDITEMTGKTSG